MITPRHQWTNGGSEVLIVKCVSADGRTYNNFQWPLTVGAEIVAPDWNDKPECGGGLHGWPWGFSIGEGKEPDWTTTWLVFGADPSDIVDIGGKVKTRRAVIRFIGAWWEATNFVLAGQMAWVTHAAKKSAASATGERGAASATGERGAASATGECSMAAVTNLDGHARGGLNGCIALAWWNGTYSEMRCARIGKGFLKPNVWYYLDANGEFKDDAS